MANGGPLGWERALVERAGFVLLLLCSIVVLTFLAFMFAATEGHAVAQVVDLYTVLQYAKAMAEGHAFQYASGDAPTSGSTSLLHTALLAVGYALGARGEGLVAVAIALGALSYLLAVFLARRLGQALSGPREGLLAAVLVALGGPVVWGFLYGADIAPAMVLSLWLLERWLVLWREGRPGGFALAGGLLGLTRPEALATTLVLGAAAFWRARAWPSRRRRLACLVPVAAALLAWTLQRALSGTWLSTSVSGKSLLPNYGWPDTLALAAEYGVDVIRGLLLGLYPSQVPVGFFRGFASFQFPPLGLLLILVLLAAPGRDSGPPLRIWTATVALIFALVGPNVFMGAQFNRYLMWAFPALLCLVAAGLGETTRLLARGDARLERSLFLAGAGLVAVLGLFSTLRFAGVYGQFAGEIYRREVPTAEWIRKNLPEGVAIANVATSLEFLSGHRNVNLHGVTSAAFAGNRLVEKEAGLYEALVRFPAEERPPYLLVSRDVYESAAAYRELTTGAPLFESLSLGDDLLLFRTDYGIVGRNTRIQEPGILAVVGALRPVDELNVCDGRDEEAHGYSYASRRGELRLAGALKVDAYASPLGLKVADGGRAILGAEAFRVRTTPGRDLLVVLRTHGLAGAHSMRAAGGGFGTRTHMVPLPEELMRVYADKALVATLAFRPKPGWNEVSWTIPGPAVRREETEIRVVGRYSSFHYWFFQ
jgi:hypothetical protein